MRKKLDFLLAGVGGQGILLAGEVLGSVGLGLGYDVKKSEVHGMSQRGGSVVSHLRWGEVVHSPLVGRGDADFLLGFELLEACRYRDYLSPDGIVVLNQQRIAPLSVNVGFDIYPADEKVAVLFQDLGGRFVAFPASEVAEAVGNVKAANVVLLGRLSALLEFPIDVWEQAIRLHISDRHLEVNLKAFRAGRETGNRLPVLTGPSRSPPAGQTSLASS